MAKGELLVKEKLKQIPIFETLSEKTIEKLSKITQIRELNKGDVLFFEREKVEYIYIVLKGTVFLYRDSLKEYRRIVFLLGEGKIINEVIFDGRTASINCEAFEKSTILAFPVEKLKDVMRDDFDLSFAILTSVGHKVRKLYRQLKNATPIGLDKKLAAKLWKLSEGFGYNCYDKNLACKKKTEECREWTQVNKNISVTFLGEMLGSTRESISRELKKLENLGLIRWEYKKLLVDREKLLKFYKN